MIVIYKWIKNLAGYYTKQAYPYLSCEDLYHIGIVMFLSIKDKLDSSNNPKSYMRKKVVGAMKDEINHMRYWSKSSQARGRIKFFQLEFDETKSENDLNKDLLMKECLMILEPELRNLLLMIFYDGMTMKQISKKLKISITKVREMKSYVLNILRSFITGEKKMDKNDPVVKYVSEQPNVSASEISKALDMPLSTVLSKLKKNEIPHDIEKGKKFYWLPKLPSSKKDVYKIGDVLNTVTPPGVSAYKIYGNKIHTETESVSLQENSAILLHAKWRITKRPWHSEDPEVKALFTKLTEFQIPIEVFNIIFQIDELINNPIV